MKGIKNISNMNYSYIHSVLQSMSCLESSKQFLYQNNFQFFNQNLCLTIELYNLMSMLNNGKEAYSADIIKYYINRANLINHTDSIFSQDPYHFLFYLLELLHLENNMPPDNNYDYRTLYNQDIKNQRNDDYMYILFYDFFKRTQNSMISNFFFNIEKYTTNCMKCGTIYFYGIKKIFRFNIDLFKQYKSNFYPLIKGGKLSLDECFRCYIGGSPGPCKNCGNLSTTVTQICCTTKVLIIYLDRKNHTFYGDIDFKPTLNILNYYSIKRSNNLNFFPTYNLKACISLSSNMKYFADCNVSNNSIFNSWYRFMDDQVKILGDIETEIHQYEPQILIYELDQQNYNNNSLSFNPFLKNNDYILNFLKMNNNNNLNMQFFQNILNYNIPLNQQSISQAQIQNIQMNNYITDKTLSINQNFNFNNNINNNFNNNINNNFINNIKNNFNNFNPLSNKVAFSLKFIYVPEFGDQSETNLNRISAQVLSDFTFEKAVNNFFCKLVKPRNAIKRFLLYEKEISPNCQSTLASLNINENTVIKAIKSQNFDQLNL